VCFLSRFLRATHHWREARYVAQRTPRRTQAAQSDAHTPTRETPLDTLHAAQTGITMRDRHRVSDKRCQ